MVSTVNTGSVNMPKLLRHLSSRTNNVRDVIFHREPIYNKSTKTTKSGGTLSGPAVNFGYETATNTTVADGTDSVYHVITPELTLGGLKVLQTPVISRSGKLERTGARISGECEFYTPSLATIRQLDNFSETHQFDEFEAYDKFIDIERAVYTGANVRTLVDFDNSADTSLTYVVRSISPDGPTTVNPGYEVDRLQFKVKAASGTNISNITITGTEGGSTRSLKWTATDTCSPTDWLLIDLPIRDITAGDTKEVYKDGTGLTFTAGTNDTMLDVDKLYGDSNNYLSSLRVNSSATGLVELKDINIYKSAEWSLESIKDYRDEYMHIKAVRVRGDRTSRRRAYG